MNREFDATAVALAGGRSRRMGKDKATTLLEGVPLIEWVADSARQAGFKTIVIRDDEGGNRGPLSGAVTALRRARSAWVLLLPCDMPFLPPELLLELLRAASPGDLGVVTTTDQRVGFPMALRDTARPRIEGALDSGVRTVQSVFNSPEFRPYRPDEKWAPRLQNVNTPQDLHKAADFVRKNQLCPPALSKTQSSHEKR